MGLEVYDFIGNMTVTNPAAGDSAGQGDDHIRGMKVAAKATLPSATFPLYAWSEATDVASAATCDLGAVASMRVRITGTTTITSFGTVAAGVVREGWFASSLLLTHDATSLILPRGYNITTRAGDYFRAISLGSGNWRVLTYSRALPVYPQGMLWGLTLSNAADATNDITVAAGIAMDETGVYAMQLSSAITKQLDNTWAVGTDQGGLDTGSASNTTYHVWLIARSDTGVVDTLFSTSASSPTMPSNYDYKRRIGSILRESAAIVAFSQKGDEFLRTPLSDFTDNNPGTSAQTVTLSVPTGIKVGAVISLAVIDFTPSSDTNVLLTAIDQANTAPSSTIYDGKAIGLGASSKSIAQIQKIVRTNTSAQVRYRIDTSTADHYVRLTTHGWIDTRGRLA